MLYDVYAESPHKEQMRMNDDQITYAIEKQKIGKKIKIKFGDNIARKAGIFKGEKLQVHWDDANKMMIIGRSDKGFTVYKQKNQKHCIIFIINPKLKLPEGKKIFNNIPIDSQHRITLDFSFDF